MTDYLNDFILNLLNTSVNGILILLTVLLICLFQSKMSSQVKSRILFLAFASLFVVFLSMPFIQNIDFMPEKETYSVINMNEYRQQELVSRSDRLLTRETEQKEMNMENLQQSVPGVDILASILENWQKGLFLVWFPGFLWCVIQLMAGFTGVCRIRRNAVEHKFAEYEKVASQLNYKKQVRVMINEFHFSPFTFGFFHPIIILPKEAIRWSAERLEVVFMHEMVHIEEADFLKNIFIRMVCAIFWFNPFVWRTLKQYHFEQESACDIQVVNNGIQPYVYAKELLELTRSCRTIHYVSSLIGSRKSNTEKRIIGILSNNRNPVFSKKQYILVTSAIIFGLLFSAFTFTFVRAENLTPSSDVPNFWPVCADSCYISSGFGDKILTETGVNKDINRGINVSWKGAILKAYATADGTVEQVSEDSFGKIAILIGHKNGYSTYYKSLCSSLVKEGDIVCKGDAIGAATGIPKTHVLSKATGNVDFQLEIRKGNKVIDPMLLIELPERASVAN